MASEEAAGAAGFGDQLKQLREARGLSRRALGMLARIDGNTISYLERGSSGWPRPRTAQALADALGISLATLLPDPDGIRAAVQAGRVPCGHDDLLALSRALGVQYETVLAMSNDTDPFGIGAPAHWEGARWFTALWDQHQFPRGVHLRRIHYILVSRPTVLPTGQVYLNTLRAFEYLMAASAWARILELVPADAFDDRRNPDPHLYAYATESDEPTWTIESRSSWALPKVPFWMLADLVCALPEVSVSGYDYRPHDQPYHLEVWIEKSTMDDVLLPLCQAYSANLVTSVGFQSITNVVKLLKRIAPIDKPVRIFYISDFDPAGNIMPVGVARQVEFWRSRYAPASDIKLTSLALTHAQVEQYQLPRVPLKDSDTRGTRFEDAYGEGAVELDALEALYPGVLGSLVRTALAGYRDATLKKRLAATQDEASGAIFDEWQSRD